MITYRLSGLLRPVWIDEVPSLDKKAKGRVLIAIGSTLMMICSAVGLVTGILYAYWGCSVGSGWLVLRAIMGFIMIPSSVLPLVFSIMCLKRWNDRFRSTFPLVIGIIFSALVIFFLFYRFSVTGLVVLSGPVLILIGASMNKVQLRPGVWQQASYLPGQGPNYSLQPYRQSPTFLPATSTYRTTPIKAPYVASEKSRIFHRISCSHAPTIELNNRVYFATRRKALQSGRIACRTCMH